MNKLSLQYKWDVYIWTQALKHSQAKLYFHVMAFMEKHNLDEETFKALLRVPRDQYPAKHETAETFIINGIPKLKAWVFDKDISDVFDIASKLEGTSIDSVSYGSQKIDTENYNQVQKLRREYRANRIAKGLENERADSLSAQGWHIAKPCSIRARRK